MTKQLRNKELIDSALADAASLQTLIADKHSPGADREAALKLARMYRRLLKRRKALRQQDMAVWHHDGGGLIS